MSWDIFFDLCTQKNVTPRQVSIATGVSSQTLSGWKRGEYTPKEDKRKKIADYFGVSLKYLDTGLDDEKRSAEGDSYYFNNKTAEMAQKLFENKDLRVLFDAAQDASPEDLQIAYDMLLALKSKENKKDG